MIFGKYLRGLGFAISGIAYAFRSQMNMRFHVFAAFLAVIFSIILRIAPLEWCVILFCIGSVLAAELINTSLELNVDLSSPEYNEKAGQAKDLAAAAVLTVSVISAVIGSIIFVPKIINLI